MQPFPLARRTRERLARAGDEFAAEFLERQLARHPDDLPALVELSNLLTQLGRVEDGLKADQRLVRQFPEEPGYRYNLACSLALLGRTSEALTELETSIELGYDDLEHLVLDTDLDALREEPRYLSLVRRLEAGLSSR